MGKSRAVRPTISLCMIARNEANNLMNCLDSVKGITDEIVLVDTGSTDSTPEVAAKLGARVEFFPWNDSFSEARNFSLSLATGDWVLVLDPDERLDESAKDILQRAICQPDAEALNLIQRNYLSNDDTADVVLSFTCRLWRNRSEYRYSGRVHEDITRSIRNCGAQISDTNVIIHHHGNLSDRASHRDRIHLYRDLLRAELADHPGDACHLYNLGMSFYASEDYNAAKRYLEQAAANVNSESKLAGCVFGSLASAFCLTGEHWKALATAKRAEMFDIRHPEINFAAGQALSTLNRYRDAIAEFESAVSLGQGGGWMGDSAVWGHKSRYAMAMCYWRLGEYNKAARHAQLAIRDVPDLVEAHELLADIFLSTGDCSSAEREFRKLIELGPRNNTALNGLGLLLATQGRIEEAMLCFTGAIESDPTNASSYFNAADVMYAEGEYSAASDLYSCGLMQKPDFAPAFLMLGNCYFQLGVHESAMTAYRQALSVEPDYADAAENLAHAEEALARKKAA